MKIDRSKTEGGNDVYDVILPPGEYEFKVIKSVKATSAQGKQMWKVTFAFPEFNGAYATEYFSEVENMAWKFAQFFNSIGLNSDDTDDMKEQNTWGATGRCTVYTDHSEQYGDRNRIRKFLKAEGFEPEASDTLVKPEDLPF